MVAATSPPDYNPGKSKIEIKADSSPDGMYKKNRPRSQMRRSATPHGPKEIRPRHDQPLVFRSTLTYFDKYDESGELKTISLDNIYEFD